MAKATARQRPEQKAAHAGHQRHRAEHDNRGAAWPPAPESSPRPPRRRPPCTRDLPSDRWRCVFSSTTMASSTSGPMARARPPSVMALMVLPVTYRPMMRAEDRQRDRHAWRSASSASCPGRSGSSADTSRAPMTPSWIRLADGLADVDRLVHDEIELDVVPSDLQDRFHVRDVASTPSTTASAAGPLLAVDGHVDLPLAVDAHAARSGSRGVSSAWPMSREIDAVAGIGADRASRSGRRRSSTIALESSWNSLSPKLAMPGVTMKFAASKRVDHVAAATVAGLAASSGST